MIVDSNKMSIITIYMLQWKGCYIFFGFSIVFLFLIKLSNVYIWEFPR